jgi:hypothetical protein
MRHFGGWFRAVATMLASPAMIVSTAVSAFAADAPRSSTRRTVGYPSQRKRLGIGVRRSQSSWWSLQRAFSCSD